MRIYRYVGSFLPCAARQLQFNDCITRGEVLSWRKGMLVCVQEMDVPLAGKFALLLWLNTPSTAELGARA